MFMVDDSSSSAVDWRLQTFDASAPSPGSEEEFNCQENWHLFKNYKIINIFFVVCVHQRKLSKLTDNTHSQQVAITIHPDIGKPI